MAVYEEQEAQQRGVANSRPAPSPDLHQSELSVFQPVAGGEIEVNSSVLKSRERSERDEDSSQLNCRQRRL
ncbi:hypothetical protein EYF80_001127 [Liparis tanakae]|uniref:Uncharacterized protein n=1 Tax=Liparis tanakae TaxID=230148 RepID=A0A4Z2JEV1_9TELE|nr:hypothetical protein EYF80_001127 [Liparis tanakae]